MTRAEAIEVLQFLQDGDYPKRTEALQMGIEALKGLSGYESTICKLAEILAEKCKRARGKWILSIENQVESYHCSVCGMVQRIPTIYCTRCKADMRDKIDKETQDAEG